MESEESLVTFMDFNKVFLMMSDFKDKGEVMMISQMASFNMNPIEVIVMSNLFSPNLSDLRVLPFMTSSMVSVVVNFTKMFQNEVVNNNFFVSHG